MRLRSVRVLNALCLLLLAGLTVWLALRWGELPPQVPGHYNAAGEIDRWAGRGTLLLTPALAWAMYGGLTLVERHPAWWNTGVKITEENRARVYGLLARMVATVKLLLAVMLAVPSVYMALGRRLPAAVLPLELLALFGTLIYYFIRLYRLR